MRLRSYLFTVLFYLWTIFTCLLFLPILALPLKDFCWIGSWWAHGTNFLLRTLCGITYEIRGKEHLINGPCLIVSKHQSAWETIVLYLVGHRPSFVLKQELRKLPLFGLFVRRMGMIALDRQAKASALRSLLEQSRKALASGRSIIIFPEGTRVLVGESSKLQAGVTAMYQNLNVPVVPLALNSGYYWRRDTYIKKPGTIILEVHPPIAPGLPRDEFMQQLEQAVLVHSDILGQEVPH